MFAKNLPAIRRKLLRWYDKNRRDLPWRRTRDPYAIWIAETMLQQTQVTTVLDYYEKFLGAFPTVQALDRAPLEQVLRAWSGLGYYRRAENLKKAARRIRRAHGGDLPREFHSLRQLAGIGDYTAGALMSIAFRRRYPAVDGNVRRVLGRVFARAEEKKLKAIATELVPRSRPGDFNQALMELGATICSPKDPKCEGCPLAPECAARSRSAQPQPTTRPSRVEFTDVTWPLAIVRLRGKILLRQRADNGLLARLWELPGRELEPSDKPISALRKELKPLSLTLTRQQPIGEIRHSITHRRIRAPVYFIECPAAAKIRLPGKQWRWIDPAALANQAVSSMTAKALNSLRP